MKRIFTFITIVATMTNLAATPVYAQTSARDLQWPFYVPESAGACSPTATTGSLDRFLQTLAAQENGGKVTGVAAGSTASGKYQYINDTWRSSAQAYYQPALQYAQAQSAPEEIQDAVVYLEYTAKSQTYAGDFFKMAITHYNGSYPDDPALLDKVPGAGAGNRLTLREYGTMLVERMNSGFGSEVSLKYSQAPQFSEWLAKVGGTASAAQTSSSCGTGGGIAAIAARALQEVGKTESPRGSNCGPDIDIFFTSLNQKCGYAWCAVFVRYIFKEAGLPLNTNTNMALGIGDWFKQNKFFYTASDAIRPQVGDVYVKRRGGNGQGHTGIIVAVNGYQIETVDGNISDKVNKRTYQDYRLIPELVGFGRYTDADSVDPDPNYDPSQDIPTEVDNDGLSEE